MDLVRLVNRLVMRLVVWMVVRIVVRIVVRFLVDRRMLVERRMLVVMEAPLAQAVLLSIAPVIVFPVVKVLVALLPLILSRAAVRTPIRLDANRMIHWRQIDIFRGTIFHRLHNSAIKHLKRTHFMSHLLDFIGRIILCCSGPQSENDVREEKTEKYQLHRSWNTLVTG